MNHERRMQILEAWKTEAMPFWRPAQHGNHFECYLKSDLPLVLDLHEVENQKELEVDKVTFIADFLGRVYCEGLFIGIFPKLRAR